jgi:hypothetical protein
MRMLLMASGSASRTTKTLLSAKYSPSPSVEPHTDAEVVDAVDVTPACECLFRVISVEAPSIYEFTA